MSTQDALTKARAQLTGRALVYAEIAIEEGTWRYDSDRQLVEVRRHVSLDSFLSSCAAMFPGADLTPTEAVQVAEVETPLPHLDPVEVEEEIATETQDTSDAV